MVGLWKRNDIHGFVNTTASSPIFEDAVLFVKVVVLTTGCNCPRDALPGPDEARLCALGDGWLTMIKCVCICELCPIALMYLTLSTSSGYEFHVHIILYNI